MAEEKSDPYSRFDYRQLIAWPERIKREWPLYEAVFSSVPLRRLLDLGSGTGEHSRFLGEKGFDVTGVDSSPAMLEKSTDQPLPPNVRFVAGDLTNLRETIDGTFGGAMCVGNVLPHLDSQQALDGLATGLRALVIEGGAFVLQLLNYDRIHAKQERFLPINFRPDPEEGEIVFLRLMQPLPDGRVMFIPSTLRLRTDREMPLEVVHSRAVMLRGWRHDEIVETFRRAGFSSFEAYGSFDRKPFDPVESRDLILVVR